MIILSVDLYHRTGVLENEKTVTCPVCGTNEKFCFYRGPCKTCGYDEVDVLGLLSYVEARKEYHLYGRVVNVY